MGPSIYLFMDGKLGNSAARMLQHILEVNNWLVKYCESFILNKNQMNQFKIQKTCACIDLSAIETETLVLRECRRSFTSTIQREVCYFESILHIAEKLCCPIITIITEPDLLTISFRFMMIMPFLTTADVSEALQYIHSSYKSKSKIC